MAAAAVVDVEARSILTPATGFIRRYAYTLNPYSGCAFACEYCYARAFARTPSLSDSWGTWVEAKRNARALVGRACAAGKLRSGDAVYLSSVTDPYQPVERYARITRGVLETILEYGVQPRLTVQTRSPIAARDIDLFRRFEHIRVNISVTTDSEAVRLRYEPHAPAIKVRLQTAEAIAAAGIPIGICVSPMLPVVDAEAFALRLASLDAAEYVAQSLQPVTARFAAGSTLESLRMAQDDGWGEREYRRAFATLQRRLGGRLLEGDAGFSPAG